MKEKDVQFQSIDGITIYGVLTTPDSDSISAVLMTHGIASEKHEKGFYRDLAKLLTKHNLASLRFDFRGHGDSDGESHEMTITGEIADLSAAVEFLIEKGYKKFSIIGTSFGAAISVLYVGDYSDITSLILLCPVLDYKRTFLEPETPWAQKWFTPQALLNAKKTGTLDLGGFLLGKELVDEFLLHKPGETLLESGIPFLIIHGIEDDMVSHSISKHYGEKHIKGKFISVKGAGHGLKGFEKKVFPEIVSWILDHINL